LRAGLTVLFLASISMGFLAWRASVRRWSLPRPDAGGCVGR
jgi:hypothetical protein